MASMITLRSWIRCRHRLFGVIVFALVVVLVSAIAPVVSAEEGQHDDLPDFFYNNYIPHYDPRATACVAAVDNSTIGTPSKEDFEKPAGMILIGKNNAEKVMNFLTSQGFDLAPASGIMGNFSWESGFSPTTLNPNGGAFGLAQWLGSRKDDLKAYGGKKYDTLEVQLQFVMFELAGKESRALVVKNETLPGRAARVWENTYERANGHGMSERIHRAEMIYNEWRENKSFSEAFLKSIGSSGSSAPSEITETTALCDNPPGESVLGYGDLKDYAFPIAVTSKKSIDSFGGALNTLPCYGTKCHRGNYAFDLGVTGYGEQDRLHNPNSIGAPVYAISAGKITSRRDNPNAIRTNCTQITLRSSVDDHDWWYGHLTLKGAAVQQGQSVKAGDLMGYVGPSNCADGTMPHLHIDSGAGYTNQRNRLVSDVINGLYKQLPG